MKKVNIIIKETEINDEFEEQGHKIFTQAEIIETDEVIEFALERMWGELKNYFLKNRNEVAFRRPNSDNK